MSNIRVRVYSTPQCPWCARAKEYLSSKEIEFEDIDVSRNREAAIEMIRMSGQQGVPQLLIGDSIVIGFNQHEIDRLLNL